MRARENLEYAMNKRKVNPSKLGLSGNITNLDVAELSKMSTSTYAFLDSIHVKLYAVKEGETDEKEEKISLGKTDDEFSNVSLAPKDDYQASENKRTESSSALLDATGSKIFHEKLKCPQCDYRSRKDQMIKRHMKSIHTKTLLPE